MAHGVSFFEPVASGVKLPELEVSVMEIWETEKTFERSLDLRRGAPRFVFYEGPPTANGRPGTHHILARAFKDVFGRYKTMKGFFVERKAGWDTHGLPVELEIEKSLNISGKQQIEEYGIARFNELCRESVYRYVDEWVRFSNRMAFWQDYEHAYWTLTPDYIQSVWWALKRMWDRDLVYQGFRVAPYCPRCATPLSSHELAQGYQDDTEDPSVFVRFRLKDDPATSLLAWTTTPWTLPGNVSLAVSGELTYVRVRQGLEYLILAEDRLEVLEGDFEVVERFSGRRLEGMAYEPVFDYLAGEVARFTVSTAGFVATGEGTGVVHVAAGYGADDLKLAQEKGIPVRHTVDLRGRFVPEVTAFAGLFVKDADPLIIEDLRVRGLLYRGTTIRHTYPFCWRCKTPLIYYALDSWYVRTTAVKDLLVANNQATNWIPGHVRAGRMGDWLENNVDWAISRSRYWGTPLPFWRCEACGHTRCVAAAEELGLDASADLHRPAIDAVHLVCEKCGGRQARVPDVLDAWFDSGSMPFAQRGYPRQGKEDFEASFPADFISEAMDQTRGWFYSLLAVSTLLFGENAYRNVICLGLVLDPRGQKASKSRGNVLDPAHLFDQFGADAVRWFYYTSAPAGENYRTSPEALREVVRQFFMTLWNVHSFFVTYANIDGFQPGVAPEVPMAERSLLDRWLISRLDELTDVVDSSLERFDVTGAARPLHAFVDDLSNWYVRRSRRRFWKSADDRDKLAAYQTLHETLVTLARLLAPFVPFFAEALHRNLAGGASAHLADFPVTRIDRREAELERQMEAAREAVELGRAARDAVRINVRQPLRSVTLTRSFEPELAAIVAEELNVKEVRRGEEFSLDTEVTDDLRLEGMARELVRSIQERRKRTGLKIEDRIELQILPEGEWARVWERYGDYIAGEVLARHVVRGRPGETDGHEVDSTLWYALKAVD